MILAVSAKISLGDSGRKKEREKINQLYIEGLKEYKARNYAGAIELWEAILEIDPRFDPAIDALSAANKRKQMQDALDEILRFE